MAAAFCACGGKSTQTAKTDYGNIQNPLYGKLFDWSRDMVITGISENSWKNICGNYNYTSNGFQTIFAQDEYNNYVLIFLEPIQDNNRSSSTGKIMDTVNIGKLKKGERYDCNCYDMNYDDASLAILLRQGKSRQSKLRRAWQVNLKTGMFETVENFDNIICDGEW